MLLVMSRLSMPFGLKSHALILSFELNIWKAQDEEVEKKKRRRRGDSKRRRRRGDSKRRRVRRRRGTSRLIYYGDKDKDLTLVQQVKVEYIRVEMIF